MKSVRNKKASNSSFLSNHDLLQNFRNKSFKLITRQASLSELKPGPKKVSLIQKKNYHEQSKENKENDQLLSNRKMTNAGKGQTQRQKPVQEFNPEVEVQKVIKELNFIYDQISMEEIELKMILNKNIRKIKEIFSRANENGAHKDQQSEQKQELKEKVNMLSQKYEDQSKKVVKYKKECNQMKEKLHLYERQVSSLQAKVSQRKTANQELSNNFSLQRNANLRTLTGNHSQTLIQPKMNLAKPQQQQQPQLQVPSNQIQILQNIIQTQQELISKQMTDFEAQNQEFFRILHIQALQIQELVRGKTTSENQEKLTPKHFVHDQRSTAMQSKYDSSTNFRGPTVNDFSQYNSPQRTEDLIAKVSKKKNKTGDFSICLY